MIAYLLLSPENEQFFVFNIINHEQKQRESKDGPIFSNEKLNETVDS